MTGFRTLLYVLPLAFEPTQALACGLALTMRAHSDRVVFGDPLYVEVAVVNRSEKPISVLRPDLMFATVSFRIAEATGLLSCRTPVGSGACGAMAPVLLKPRQRLTLFCSVAMPQYADFDEPLFWRPLQDGGSVLIQAEYTPYADAQHAKPFVSPGHYDYRRRLVSAPHYVRLEPRPRREVAVLRSWEKKQFPWSAYKHHGHLLGTGFLSGVQLPGLIPNRFELANFAREAALSGELGEWVRVWQLLHEAYWAHPAAREEANQKLLAWLKREPDFIRYFGLPESRAGFVDADSVLAKWRDPSAHEYLFLLGDGKTFVRVHYDVDLKRQVLAHELYEIAAGEQVLASTAKALSTLIRSGHDDSHPGRAN